MARSTADRRERVEQLFSGQGAAQPLVSLWCHFPHHDRTPEGLAAATIDFQKRHDFDFIKLTPSNVALVADWGVEGTFVGDPRGTQEIVRRPIHQPDDWQNVGEPEVGYGPIADLIQTVRLIRDEFDGAVPIFQTIFSPLTIAYKLAGDLVFEHLRSHPDAVRQALSVITSTMDRVVEESIDAGADGIFLATQTASASFLTADEYLDFGQQYDYRLLRVVHRYTRLSILHAHGDNLLFDLLCRYPVAALNWHDRAVGPSLAEARERFEGVLVGGIDEWNTLLDGPEDAIAEQARDAAHQVPDSRLVVAPGCVIPYQTPSRHVAAVREAVRAL